MKLFKKVLAAALVGVLALSVLTGCGSGSGTVDYTSQVVKALNNAYAEGEEEITVTEGDAAMKPKPKSAPTRLVTIMATRAIIRRGPQPVRSLWVVVPYTAIRPK